jgi:glycosyltransferase involved in cell wall biosynthesis
MHGRREAFGMSDRVDHRGLSASDSDHGDEPLSGSWPVDAPWRSSRPLTIAHDYFTQRGGAERVAAALISALRPDRVVTAVSDPDRSFPLAVEHVETTMLQRWAAFRADPRRALPLLPLAWNLVPPVTEGVVLCSSSGWSHGITVTGDAKKIVYCHNPARWLYQPEDYFLEQPWIVRATMRLIRPLLSSWDKSAASTADLYIANSTNVAERIRRTYAREAVVIYPPVSMDADGEAMAVPGVQPGAFLTVGRGRGYKNVESLVEAFAGLPDERLVVVGARPRGDIPPNVTVLRRVSDPELRWLYRSARALVSVSHEDFGLTPIEANMFGTPALLLRAGGFVDSLAEGVSGAFIDDPSAAGIRSAVRSFPLQWDEAAIREHANGFSLDAFLLQLEAVVDLLVTT